MAENGSVGLVVSAEPMHLAERICRRLLEVWVTEGVLLAVPTLAVLRVLFDFFRARLSIRE
jgi:hypothetical protein